VARAFPTQDHASMNAWVLSMQPLLLSRWVLGLFGFHGNIMLLVQMFHKEIFGQIGCIVSFNLANKPMPIFSPNHTSLATQCDTFSFELEEQKKGGEKFEMFK
jgi:hypothetical protein